MRQQIYVLKALFEDLSPNYVHVIVPRRFKLTYLPTSSRISWTNDRKKVAAMYSFLIRNRDKFSMSDIKTDNPYEVSKLEKSLDFLSTTNPNEVTEWQASENFMVLADALGLIDTEENEI